MTGPIFDHEKPDVYRLSIEDTTASHGIVKALTGANHRIRTGTANCSQIGLDSAAVHDILAAVAALARKIAMEADRVDAHSIDPAH